VGVSSPDQPPERDVLSSLPRTRPQRRSAKRDAPGAGTPAKPRRATPPKAKPAVASAKAASAAPKPKPTPKAKPQPQQPPQRKAQPQGQPQGEAPPRSTPPPPRSVEPPSRTDVLAGAVQAAGELAQAGLAVGGELVRVALSRLPRP
jgi:hypothetical protein